MAVLLSQKKLKLYHGLAVTASLAGTCPRAQVGAVLVGDDRVIGLGYNGSPRGTPHCQSAGCWLGLGQDGREHCYRAVHAESNALVNAAYAGAATNQAILVTTHRPCVTCLKLLINAGIQTAYYEHEYEDVRTNNLLALLPEFNLFRI